MGQPLVRPVTPITVQGEQEVSQVRWNPVALGGETGPGSLAYREKIKVEK